ncbi:MAG: ester cyclase [Anaerolineaceae bacterium]|nr:ester cyclase [Anaerolineaceae bacterium]
MTENNKWIVREFISAINNQDWQKCSEILASDFVRHSGTFGQSEVNNKDRLLEYLQAEYETFPDAQETINFLVAEGNKVVVHSHCHATQKGPMGSFPPSGKVLSADFISIYRIADGRIAEAWVEWDSLAGLIQLGHLEPPTMQK